MDYAEFLSNLNSGVSNQSFSQYATGYGIPVVYNQDTQSLLVNNTPVSLANSGLTMQNGQVYGTEDQYMKLISPFVSGNSGTVGGLMNQQAYQTPDYIKQFMQETFEAQQSPFSYDFENDPSVINAREQVERSVAEMAGQRGFLYGSEQQGIVGQQMKGLYGQFEELAYQKEQDFLNRQMKMAGVVMQWDQMQADRKMSDTQLWQTKADFILKLQARDLETFKVILDQRRFEMEMLLENQKFEMEKKSFELSKAYKKMESLGYADKEVALILGIPQGTRAQWVQKLMATQEKELAIMKQKHTYDLKTMEANKKIEMELMAEKDKINTASSLRLMQQEYRYKTAMAELSERQRREVEAKRQAEAEAKARVAEAAAEAKAAQKEKEKFEKEQMDTQMNNEYSLAERKFKAKFVSGGLVPDKYLKKATDYLFEEYYNGTISRATYNRLMAYYGIPEYLPGMDQKTTQESMFYSEPVQNMMSYYSR